jgi:hypothetical protein
MRFKIGQIDQSLRALRQEKGDLIYAVKVGTQFGGRTMRWELE